MQRHLKLEIHAYITVKIWLPCSLEKGCIKPSQPLKKGYLGSRGTVVGREYAIIKNQNGLKLSISLFPYFEFNGL